MPRYTVAQVNTYCTIRGRIMGSRVFMLQIVGLVFIALKLTHSLSWSWWWITAPFWGGLSYLIIGMIGITILGLLWTYEAKAK